ncbi:hypothetical protein [Staphylococcus marylandisciuri]|nr:hypothetical protein [Staphylococcus marylandisciuri]
MKQTQYDKAYKLFEEYERSFELDTSLAMTKCEMLFALGYYLELREETIVILKQGIGDYDAMMIYYAKALSGLGQYFEVVEVVNQIIDEVQNHKTRMELYPIKEYALDQINQYNRQAQSKLQIFNELSLREQIQTILTLIDYNQYSYLSTVAGLIETYQLPANLYSIMLEYLRLGNYNDQVQFNQYGYHIKVTPSNLPGLEHTSFKEELIPKVLRTIENHATQLLNEAYKLLTNHSILLYPLNILELGSLEEWTKAYENYFMSMLGFEELDDKDELIQLIVALDSHD